MNIQQADRIGRQGVIRLGCSAAIFDNTGTKLLLTQRADNGQWCLPGGIVEAGESVAETCVREVWEETGLRVKVTRLIGVYSNPHLLVEYPDGKRFQQISLCFEAAMMDGDLGLSDETLAYGFYTQEEIQQMDVLANSVQRIQDAFTHASESFIR
jgi:ADP-ribose pyrophosphatase YjhB (NUDIX family)